jgi:hypothetical protein
MTIDTDLLFQSKDFAVATGTRVFIVETKSANGRGLADKLLRVQGERPTKRCSKYCLGMAVTGRVSKYNRFLPALRKLGLTAKEHSTGRWSELRADLQTDFEMPSMLPQFAAE